MGNTGADHVNEEGTRRRDGVWIVIADDRLHGADDLVGMASDGGTMFVEEFVLLSEVCGGWPRVIPDVGVLGDDAQDDCPSLLSLWADVASGEVSARRRHL